MRLGELPIVSAYIQPIMNEDAKEGHRAARYDDTWGTEPVFDILRGLDAYRLDLAVCTNCTAKYYAGPCTSSIRGLNSSMGN